MTFTIKWTEKKQDGWTYEVEQSLDTRGIFGMDEDSWRRINLSVYTNREFFAAKNNEERRTVILDAIEEELDAIGARLRYDLRHNVSIYPLIKRKEQ